MDIRELILKRLGEKEEIKVRDITKLTGFSRAYINRFLRELREEGKIALLGKANRARYVARGGKAEELLVKGMTSTHRMLRNKELSEDIIFDEIKKRTGILKGIPDHVFDIVYYAFTEMLNNAIEHSMSKNISLTMRKGKDDIKFRIIDKGIGIFNNIMQKKHLKDIMEAIQDLTKGKLSTAPEAHTGEGIFFTSKIGSELIIESSRKKIIFDNTLNDIFIKDKRNIEGTRVSFTVGLNAEKKLENVFRQYTDDSLEFNKTRVRVILYKEGSKLISRSQARRILSGLNKFKTVTLDFENVDTVGQGFADEIFRVWKKRHPDIAVIPENANENVRFMINRASK